MANWVYNTNIYASIKNPLLQVEIFQKRIEINEMIYIFINSNKTIYYIIHSS